MTPAWTPWHGDLRRVIGDDIDFYESMPPSAVRAEIIVPTFGQEPFTIRCFDSLLAHTSAYRLVWVDNGSSAAGRAEVAEAFVHHAHRLSIQADRNLGFVGGTNLGLQAVLGDHASDAEYIVLLNNDTEVTAGWLDRLIGALERDPSIAGAGPMSSDSSMPDISGDLTGTFGEFVIRVSMLPFFCIALRKHVVARVGFLDPAFGMGLGDDDDYCFRLCTAGYGLGFVPGAYVVHHHRTTFRANYSDAEIAAMQERNRATFRARHALDLPGHPAERGGNKVNLR